MKFLAPLTSHEIIVTAVATFVTTVSASLTAAGATTIAPLWFMMIMYSAAAVLLAVQVYRIIDHRRARARLAGAGTTNRPDDGD